MKFQDKVTAAIELTDNFYRVQDERSSKKLSEYVRTFNRFLNNLDDRCSKDAADFKSSK